MQLILDRIASWEAAGVIDAEVAARLRSDELERASASLPDQHVDPDGGRQSGASTVSRIFGPAVTIGEMFAYLGGAFILGAFDVFLARAAGFDAEDGIPLAVGYGVVAIVLVAIGRFLAQGNDRQRRAAGAVFAVAVGHVAAAAVAATGAAYIGYPLSGVVIAGWSALIAGGLRLYLPALTTQATLLASLTALAAAVLSTIEDAVVVDPVFNEVGEVVPSGGPDPLLLLVASAAWWLGFAALLGVLGLLEARGEQDPATGRRAALTRLWAGITAVIGLATTIFMSGYDPVTGEWGRYLEPWIGDLALIVLAAVLVERAFRRGANSFIYAAALAIIIALTDFNFSYLTDSTEAGLLIEGLILLAAGFAVSKLRQRIGSDQASADGASLPAPA